MNGRKTFFWASYADLMTSLYNPQNEKLHRIKTKSCLAENETSPIKLHPTLAQ